MENNTVTSVIVRPLVVDCMADTNEYEPLWITAMVVVSAMLTMVGMVIRKYRARSCAPHRPARRLSPLPPPRLGKGGEEEEEIQEMV